MVQAAYSVGLDETPAISNRLRSRRMAVLRRRINTLTRFDRPDYFAHLIAKLKERLNAYYGPSPSQEATDEAPVEVYGVHDRPVLKGKPLGRPKPAEPTVEEQRDEAAESNGEQAPAALQGKRLKAPKQAGQQTKQRREQEGSRAHKPKRNSTAKRQAKKEG